MRFVLNINNFRSIFLIRYKCGFLLNEALHASYVANRRAFDNQKFELELMKKLFIESYKFNETLRFILITFLFSVVKKGNPLWNGRWNVVDSNIFEIPGNPEILDNHYWKSGNPG